MRPVLLLVLVLLSAGCATTMARIQDLAEPVEIPPGRGIVLIYVESNASFTSLLLSNGVRIGRVDHGGQVYAFHARPGLYYFLSVENYSGYGIQMFRLPRDEANVFAVMEGRTSYPGHLVLHVEDDLLYSRLANRASEALDHVQRTAPWILERYPLTYTGPVRDDFLAEVQALWKVRGIGPPAAPADAPP